MKLYQLSAWFPLQVVYVEQQQHKVRVKRDFVDRDLAQRIVQNEGQLDDPFFPNEWYLNPGGEVSKRFGWVTLQLITFTRTYTVILE